MGLFGQARDLAYRFGTGVRQYLASTVDTCRRWIYDMGYGISSKRVEDLLKPTSSTATSNAFFEKLGDEVNLHQMLVVDFMHEFELGTWKALFIHLIRLLYAQPHGNDLVVELDRR